MNAEGFEATFSIAVDRDAAWRRLTETPSEPGREGHFWLPGFDSAVTVVEADEPSRLLVTKDEEPCAGTEIVITLEEAETGTRIHVVQSRFGDWLGSMRPLMEVGWRQIVADLQAYLATGVHARRFLRPFSDFGAATTAADGGLRITNVQAEGLASRLGLVEGDLLVELDGAAVIGLDDLFTLLRLEHGEPTKAVYIRGGRLVTTGQP